MSRMKEPAPSQVKRIADAILQEDADEGKRQLKLLRTSDRLLHDRVTRHLRRLRKSAGGGKKL